MRKAGILLPITSLPSEYGIGCFSQSAYNFIDWLAEAGQTYWQILPLGPTGYGDSPYQSFSTFAGNPYLISLKELIVEGTLSKEECDKVDFGSRADDIDYNKMYQNRLALLHKAFERSDISENEDFKHFISEKRNNLDDYALFMALKNHFDDTSWLEWPEDIRFRKPDAIKHYSDKLHHEIEFYLYIQYKFFSQWNALKSYANKKGIFIIGDIPIYVAADSADVWANPELFCLDENRFPAEVAGCPPDGFSASGQLWGNPLYNWDTHKKNNYSWWINRIRHCFEMFDILRIDHFRGFDEYYSIKYDAPDATNGEWKKGPGYELFDAVKKQLGEKAIIAEDLGFITDSVRELLSQCGFPGMKVLEFAFDSRDTGSRNDYLPHNYTQNCVAYTGTHDNQTIVSWFESITPAEREAVRNYLCDRYTPNEEIFMPLISILMQSSAGLCIIPMQDYLGYGDNARMNTPSTIGKNWRWRLTKDELSNELKQRILKTAKIYGRA